MSERINKRLAELLEKRKSDELFRKLTTFNGGVDFSSNDYLGLARSKKLHQLTTGYLERLTIKNGSTGSRLLTGNSPFAEEIEEEITRFYGAESTLLFNSGYAANMAIFSTLPQKSDVLFYDEYCHASIREGIRLSAAKTQKFKHNDLNDLLRRVKREQGNVMVSTETVFSMDGDSPDMEKLFQLKSENDFYLFLDEAHSAGLLHQDNSKADVRLITFGKAFGIHGAAVLCSKLVRDYLINFSRPLIYTTSLSPHSLAAIKAAFSLMPELDEERKKVQKLKNQFQEGLGSELKNRIISGPGAICTLIWPGNSEVTAASEFLKTKNLDVRAVKSPTVKTGSERLRICFHTFNTPQEVNLLIESIKELCQNTIS
ncbi:MAG: aminotransferase class I/II-fold pyridoxal phosphate-dependent enzyme [Flavobacteriales bacterium]